MTKKQLEREHVGESVMVFILKRSHSDRELVGILLLGWEDGEGCNTVICSRHQARSLQRRAVS